MRGTLFAENLEASATDTFTLQNRYMLKTKLQGEVLAMQGSMVAYQGDVDFDFEGGGLGKMLKKVVSAENFPLMRVSGSGEVFFANSAREVHLVYLENDALTIKGTNVLAFDATLEWDIKRTKGGLAGMAAAGLTNILLQGTGWVAITAFGTPVVLQTDQPTFADFNSAIGWSANLTTSVKSSFKAKALIGRGSGEAAQLAFEGQGFVIVQASEGDPYAAASGSSSKGGLLGALTN